MTWQIIGMEGSIMPPEIDGFSNAPGRLPIKVWKDWSSGLKLLKEWSFEELNSSYSLLWAIQFVVGGIYTVIRSKTSASVNEMGDQYVCIGPYVEMKARAEVEEEDFPPHHPLG